MWHTYHYTQYACVFLWCPWYAWKLLTYMYLCMCFVPHAQWGGGVSLLLAWQFWCIHSPQGYIQTNNAFSFKLQFLLRDSVFNFTEPPCVWFPARVCSVLCWGPLIWLLQPHRVCGKECLSDYEERFGYGCHVWCSKKSCSLVTYLSPKRKLICIQHVPPTKTESLCALCDEFVIYCTILHVPYRRHGALRFLIPSLSPPPPPQNLLILPYTVCVHVHVVCILFPPQ